MVNFISVPDMSCTIRAPRGQVLIKAVVPNAKTGDIALMMNGSRTMPHVQPMVEVHTYAGVVKGPGFNFIHEFEPGVQQVTVMMRPDFKIDGQRAMRLDEV